MTKKPKAKKKSKAKKPRGQAGVQESCPLDDRRDPVYGVPSL